MGREVAALESWSLGRSCDAPDCGRLVHGRGTTGWKAWLLGHRYCSDTCRLRTELSRVRVTS